MKKFIIILITIIFWMVVFFGISQKVEENKNKISYKRGIHTVIE